MPFKEVPNKVDYYQPQKGAVGLENAVASQLDAFSIC
jgi:hypothetical protein